VKVILRLVTVLHLHGDEPPLNDELVWHIFHICVWVTTSYASFCNLYSS